MTIPYRINQRQENGNTISELVVDGTVVCRTKTVGSTILELGTISSERRKGYATILLQYIEEQARQKGATKFRAYDILTDDNVAVCFFRKNGYNLTRVLGFDDMLEGEKDLASA